jgi:DNA polymerase-3 subunit delta'
VYARKLSNQFRTNRDEVYAELDGWIDWFREIAISKNGLKQHLFFRQKESNYLEITEKLSQRQIVKAINLLFEIRGNLKNNAIPRLALEVLMVELPFIDKN